MTYITVTEVRNSSGAPSKLVTDTQITSMIDTVEKEMARWMNTSFTPKLRIDVMDGTGCEYIYTKKNPLLKVKSLTTDDTSISVDELELKKQSGKVILANDSETGVFTKKTNGVIIEYLYGLLDESETSTTSSAATTAGTSVSITVGSITGLSDGDWCEIYGTDGNREVFQISGTPAASTIVADQLVQAHAAGSIVVLLEIPEYIRRYMMIEAAIFAAIFAIGSTYTFNASYNIGDLSVVKGVPYTHWRESVDKLLKEREMRKARIRPRPAMGC